MEQHLLHSCPFSPEKVKCTLWINLRLRNSFNMLLYYINTLAIPWHNFMSTGFQTNISIFKNSESVCQEYKSHVDETFEP